MPTFRCALCCAHLDSTSHLAKPMATQPTRDPWRVIWRIAASDGLITALLVAIAVGLLISVWMPQAPTDLVSYAQWYSDARNRFGPATLSLQTVGLFTIMRTVSFRALLALLSGCLFIRLIETGDQLRRHRDWTAALRLLSCAGALILLGGILLTHLLGWQIAGVIAREGERIDLPNGAWIALSNDASRVRRSPGIISFIETQIPGVRVAAHDESGRPLALYQTPHSDPVMQPTVDLVEDRYFAIPEAHLILRLTPQCSSVTSCQAALAQVYRSSSGKLIASAEVEGDEEMIVNGTILRLTRVPYAHINTAFNPGLWPTSVGLALWSIGLAGEIALALFAARKRADPIRHALRAQTGEEI